jgi:hypothetical protein
VPGVADNAVAWHLPVAGRGAVAGDGTANGTRPRKSSRHGSPGSWTAGSWTAGSGESALAAYRTGTGERPARLGTCVTWETAGGGREPRARERPLGGVRVLRRARAVAVWRTVSRSAVSRSVVSRAAVSGADGPTVGGSAGGGRAGGGRAFRRVVFAALGRDDQAAWRIDRRRGEDPFRIGVGLVTPACPVLGGRALGRTDVTSEQCGTRCSRPRSCRPGREPAGRERPRFRPVNWRLAARSEAGWRSILTGQAVLTGCPVRSRWAVLDRAELAARHRLTRQGAWSDLPRSAVGHARARHELARRYRAGRNGSRSALLLTERHGSAGARVSGRKLALRGHPGQERPVRHRTAWKLTRLRGGVAGRHAAGDSGPVHPRRSLTVGADRPGGLT